MEFQLLPSGERAVIVEVDDLDAVLALADAVQRRVDEARAELARARRPPAGSARSRCWCRRTPPTRIVSERAPGDSVTVHVPPPPSQAANDDTSVWATVLDVIPAAQTVMLMVIDNEHLKPVRHLLSELAATLEVSSTAAHDQVVSSRRLRRPRPAGGGRAHRAQRRRGRRGAHGQSVAGRVRGVRAGLRLPRGG